MLNKVLKSHKKTTSANIKTDVKQQEIKKLIIALSYKRQGRDRDLLKS